MASVPRLLPFPIAFLAAASVVCADEPTKPSDIETDRPDVTPYTVPKGSIQMENGGRGPEMKQDGLLI